jgi:hypothetical protein
LLELLALVVMMDRLNGLLEADGDEQTDDDGGDVDEEVAPGVGGVVGCGWTSSMGVSVGFVLSVLLWLGSCIVRRRIHGLCGAGGR